MYDPEELSVSYSETILAINSLSAAMQNLAKHMQATIAAESKAYGKWPPEPDRLTETEKKFMVLRNKLMVRQSNERLEMARRHDQEMAALDKWNKERQRGQ